MLPEVFCYFILGSGCLGIDIVCSKNSNDPEHAVCVLLDPTSNAKPDPVDHGLGGRSKHTASDSKVGEGEKGATEAARVGMEQKARKTDATSTHTFMVAHVAIYNQQQAFITSLVERKSYMFDKLLQGDKDNKELFKAAGISLEALEELTQRLEAAEKELEGMKTTRDNPVTVSTALDDLPAGYRQQPKVTVSNGGSTFATPGTKRSGGKDSNAKVGKEQKKSNSSNGSSTSSSSSSISSVTRT